MCRPDAFTSPKSPVWAPPGQFFVSDAGELHLVFGKIVCQSLRKLDVLSKSDPCVAVYVETAPGSKKYTFVMKTETLQDTHEPHFKKHLPVTVPKDSSVKFMVYDDDDGEDLDNNGLLGSVVLPYEKLYQLRSTVDRRFHYLLDDVPKVSKKDMEITDGSSQISFLVRDDQVGAISITLACFC
jgi:hypothetical protein